MNSERETAKSESLRKPMFTHVLVDCGDWQILDEAEFADERHITIASNRFGCLASEAGEGKAHTKALMAIFNFESTL